jgi:glycosyltransferase involved in cell wall biosynthesis
VEEKKTVEGVCVFGGFERTYSRGEVILKGLEKLGVPISFCDAPVGSKVFKRYPILAWKYFRMKKDFSHILVPQFGHKDVPLAWLLGRLTGKKVVFDPLVSRYETKIMDRGDAGERSFQSWYNRRIDVLAMRLPDVLIADTREHADYYVSSFLAPERRVHVVPVGCDDEIFAGSGASVERDGPARKVLFFGSYLPLHGTMTIVRAAELLIERGDVIFELVGDGQTRPETEAYARGRNLANVRFTGRVPYDELPRLIARADLCLGIFGTTGKAMRVVPNKIYQCMAMDRAVVTADTPAVREIFTDGLDIALVPAGDAQGLAHKIEELFAEPGRLRRIGERAGKFVRDRFNCKAVAARFVEACLDETRGVSGP